MWCGQLLAVRLAPLSAVQSPKRLDLDDEGSDVLMGLQLCIAAHINFQGQELPAPCAIVPNPHCLWQMDSVVSLRKMRNTAAMSLQSQKFALPAVSLFAVATSRNVGSARDSENCCVFELHVQYRMPG
mmetsp:Transcript_2570/g.7285  ORF Transcript_2570/g.7285 Transcript_2570/m.7285 type:complete len:128 (-) Transcript_2570:301-684(-)